jgi:hypothetical protein
MTMRTIECNICGEPLASATDEELLGRMRAHYEAEHPDSEWDDDAFRATIAEQAYDATDN